ncbi:hypothetical protein MLD38_027909 [Melastoma candidum]|uniref:Uncharacterized protein n=1 Tax=Melastoma candidum TaxID=119954 RepID=A0ACB9MZK7_9MYRT|nr:hypothetical protein MLD38_027909 [Melastoma candidum]
MRKQAYPATTANDYYTHISTLERTPSVLSDVPRYPNLHSLFDGRNTGARREVEKHPQFQEKVEVIEFREEKSDDGSRKEERAIVEEEVDNCNVSSFIERRHKGFELRKWKTFKAL